MSTGRRSIRDVGETYTSTKSSKHRSESEGFAKSKHLVLDIDECLVRTFMEPQTFSIIDEIMNSNKLAKVRNRVFIVDSPSGPYWGVKRPHLDEFLSYAFATYTTVSVWTAGTPVYAYEVTPIIFRNVRQPDLVMTSDDILHVTDTNIKYVKPLTKFYDKFNKLYSGTYVASSKNTVMLDNRLKNFTNNPYNGVRIHDYMPLPTVDDILKDDNGLLDFMRNSIGVFVPSDDVRLVHDRVANPPIDLSLHPQFSLYRHAVT